MGLGLAPGGGAANGSTSATGEPGTDASAAGGAGSALQVPPSPPQVLLSPSLGPLVSPLGVATATLPAAMTPAPPPVPTPPRSILTATSAVGITPGTRASVKRALSSDSGASTASEARRRITFADQHGRDLQLVHWVDDLHYSANADHSQSDDWDSDASRCTVM